MVMSTKLGGVAEESFHISHGIHGTGIFTYIYYIWLIFMVKVGK